MRSVSGFVEVSPTHGFGRRGCNTARISQVSRVGCQTIAQGFPLSRPLFLSVVTVITSVGPTRLQFRFYDDRVAVRRPFFAVSRTLLPTRSAWLTTRSPRLSVSCLRCFEANGNETLNKTFPSRIAPTRARFVSWPFFDRNYEGLFIVSSIDQRKRRQTRCNHRPNFLKS